jgi:hypothetical protein
MSHPRKANVQPAPELDRNANDTSRQAFFLLITSDYEFSGFKLGPNQA